MIGTMSDRALRAHGVAAGTAGEIQKFESGPFSVPSTGTPGTEYTVQSDGTGCNCPDHLYRRVVCKHITGARLATEMGTVKAGTVQHIPAAGKLADPFANFD
jgi:hypothetical protein